MVMYLEFSLHKWVVRSHPIATAAYYHYAQFFLRHPVLQGPKSKNGDHFLIPTSPQNGEEQVNFDGAYLRSSSGHFFAPRA